VRNETGGPAWLILENGRRFAGKSFGAAGEAVAEVVFATGMTGYLETLTDLSYYGQMVVQTFPLIGNYGVIPEDFESARVGLSAYIVREWCSQPSNFRSRGALDAFLKERGIVGLYDIDTRSLTKLLRSYGVMNGVITQNPETADMDAIRRYQILNAVPAVSVREMYRLDSAAGRFHVALYDYGLKENILRELLRRGCDVTVLPWDAPPAVLLSLCPDGVMLTNGPGDPAENVTIIRHLRQLAETGIPIFGICLGHQLLALAHGFKTEKLKYGHRGANQAVQSLPDKRVYITSQNHGYAVVTASVDTRVAEESFRNVNDGTCEGLLYKGKPIFSVQFHPEACGGPKDTAFLFDRFIGLMEVKQHAAG
jgi:carbamoyl-phosphate synthase small subunit